MAIHYYGHAAKFRVGLPTPLWAAKRQARGPDRHLNIRSVIRRGAPGGKGVPDGGRTGLGSTTATAGKPALQFRS